MDALNCVVRICKNINGDIIWSGLYLNGSRYISLNYFDIEKMVDMYSENGQYLEDIFIEEYPEDVYANIDDFFPEEEDFSYLLDMGDIEVGEPVYLFEGVFKVNKVWEDYRKKGNYKMVHWDETNGYLSCTELDNEWDGHSITKFTVEGLNDVFVWEDYNYQQSFLYVYLKESGKVI
jgi:hypothetical protein